MKTAVSIIVPSLNVAPYIEECLDSLQGQTLKEIEIICVDAFSSDGTREIICERMTTDNRIKLFNDTKASTGFAKNLGIREASGKYVAIVEPDDYVTLDMYETLYSHAEKYEANIAKANFNGFCDIGDKRYFSLQSVSSDWTDYNRIVDPRKEKQIYDWQMFTWTGIYKKDFLEAHNIVHNESKGAASQDIGFWFLSLHYAKSIYLIPSFMYCYRRDNPNSSVRQMNRIDDVCKEYIYIKERLVMEHDFEESRVDYYHTLFHEYDAAYDRLSKEFQLTFAKRFYQNIHRNDGDCLIDASRINGQNMNKLLAIMDSPEAYVGYKNSIALDRKRKREQLVTLSKGFSAIVICPAGADGTNTGIFLENEGIVGIKGFADRDSSKRGLNINGLNVYAYEDVSMLFPNAFYIVVSSKFNDEIEAELNLCGIPKERIYKCKARELFDVTI